MSGRTLGGLFPEAEAALAGLPVAGLTADSRNVGPGFVFVAVPGTVADGRRFAAKAAAAGAVAVVSEGARPEGLGPSVPYVAVADVRRSLARAAQAFSGRQPARVVAVTGTSGKSSVTDFVRQILARLGAEAASLGTVGIVTSRGATYGSLTTPDPVTLHATLARLVDDGIDDLAMEASSHGIEQRRLDGVALAAVGYTNLGRDHLDYHATMDDYLAAKLRLFTTLAQPGIPAVINSDGAYADVVVAAAAARGLDVHSTGSKGDMVRLISARTEGFHQHLALQAPGASGRLQDYTVRLPLVGGFQVENALLAAGLVLATPAGRADPAGVIAALEHLTGVPGRMERIGEANGGLCLVDYAHKPEALEGVLTALRPFATGRLRLVFGCGGDRDTGKRPIMGAIAARQADVVIVTDDNPRSEDPAAIRAAILAAAPGAVEIGDRAEAIRTAVRALEPGDVLVVAGKGHETGQIVGSQVLPFSDHDVLRAAIAERSA